jgi:hypothetical protein
MCNTQSAVCVLAVFSVRVPTTTPYLPAVVLIRMGDGKLEDV